MESKSIENVIEKIKTNFKQGQSVFRSGTDSQIEITDQDWGLLSKYEKNALKSIANIWGLLSNGDDRLSLDVMQKAIDQLTDSKNNANKNYLCKLIINFRESIFP